MLRRERFYPAAKVVVRDCLGIKPGEQVLILADTEQPSSIGTALVAIAEASAAEASLILFPKLARRGQEPSPTVAKAIKRATAIVTYAAPSPAGSKALSEALRAGARVVFLLLCDPETPSTMSHAFVESSFLRTLPVDAKEVAALTKHLAKLTGDAKEAHIFSKKGTDFTFRLGNKVTNLDGLCHQPGTINQLPAGVTAAAPLAGSANGKVVIDLSLPPFGQLSQPIGLRIKDSRIIAIDGGNEAEQLTNYLESFKDPSV